MLVIELRELTGSPISPFVPGSPISPRGPGSPCTEEDQCH